MTNSDSPKKVKKFRKKLTVDEQGNAGTVPLVASGQVLSGRYELLEELGRGSMGVVFKALDRELDSLPVAVKMLPPELSHDKRAKKRLRKEALAAIRLSHPNILRVSCLEEDENIPYIIMEFLDGGTVDDEAVSRDDEKLTLDEVLKIAEDVCKALDYAHERGVIHRDIKPSNLMYHKQGEHNLVKVSDFGIAYQTKASVARLTGFESAGTLFYASPEQLRGKKPTFATDIYSLGVTLYELLSGEPPFTGVGISNQILSRQPRPIDGLPEHVNAALLKAMAKKPEDRFENCLAFFKALNNENPVKAVPEMERASQKPKALPSQKHEPILNWPDQTKAKRRKKAPIQSGNSMANSFIIVICILFAAISFSMYIQGTRHESMDRKFSTLVHRRVKEPTPKPNEVKIVSKPPSAQTSAPVSTDRGEIAISVLPRWAEVYVDGKFIERGKRSALPMDEGYHEVKAVAQGYEGDKDTCFVSPGLISEVNLQLRQLQEGTIVFDVEPIFATVYIDKFVVTTDKWGGISRPPGVYRIRAQYDGYETFDKMFTVNSGRVTHAVIRMKPILYQYKRGILSKTVSKPEPKGIMPRQPLKRVLQGGSVNDLPAGGRSNDSASKILDLYKR